MLPSYTSNISPTFPTRGVRDVICGGVAREGRRRPMRGRRTVARSIITQLCKPKQIQLENLFLTTIFQLKPVLIQLYISMMQLVQIRRTNSIERPCDPVSQLPTHIKCPILPIIEDIKLLSLPGLVLC